MGQPTDRPRILTIDDTPDTRTLVRRLLSGEYEMIEAPDGLRGIEVAIETEPDLIMVDLHMPGLTGYEVATRLKSLLPQTPIVALTADVTDHVRERVLASGCDGYISKPLDPDQFPEQIAAFLSGRRDELHDASFLHEYHETLVARLEEKVRELSQAIDRNAELNEQNLLLLERAQRRARLLEAGARVGRNITSILELEPLLKTTVQVICDEFGLCYAGVFLIDGEEAVLRARHGQAGSPPLVDGHRIRLDGESAVAVVIRARRAGDTEEGPPSAATAPQAQMTLPLVVGDEVIGVLAVHVTRHAAFDGDDATALKAVADQLAVAINNTRLLRDLEDAHSELVRTKTFRVIAAATGEAVHWVGNKAAPIPGSVARVTEDVTRYLCAAAALLEQAPPDLRESAFGRLLLQAAADLRQHGVDLDRIRDRMEQLPPERLPLVLDVASVLEDLAIIDNSARAILNIKEDLIGPARQRHVEILALPALLDETVASMGIARGVVRTLYGSDLLPVRADRIQLSHVFINLIKNALEAMEQVAEKKLFIWARLSDDPNLVVVDVTDNGAGISPDRLDRIWMAFYTTKGDRGGTGLGLPACAQIVDQLGGRITVESDLGLGTTFSVFLPVESAQVE